MSDILKVFDVEPTSGKEVLAAIVAKAERAIALEREVEAAEEKLNTMRKELNDLKFSQIPDAMAEAGLTSFALKDGSKVKVEDYVQGSLPKDVAARAAAVIVLEAYDGAALIRNQIVVPFEKKEHNKAISLARELQDRGLAVSMTQDVHASTLQAFVREKLRAGEQLPWEKLGIFVGRRAKITPAE